MAQLLSSQYFANYYLDGLDRYLEIHSRVRAYVRYMDDIIWWCDRGSIAKSVLREVSHWLQQERNLIIKPSIQIQPSKQGVSYCGFRILQGAIRLTRRRKQRYQQRRKYWETLYLQDDISSVQLQKAYASVHAITSNIDSKAWRQQNLKRYPGLCV